VDTQPFPVSTIEPASKKVLVRPKVPDKGKGKNIVTGDPRTSIYRSEGLLRRLRTERLTSLKARGVGSIE
jgi:hypothetical protein